RGTYLASLPRKDRDQPVSGGMPGPSGKAAHVVAGHSHVPASLNSSACPNQLPVATALPRQCCTCQRNGSSRCQSDRPWDV
ncbi:unnamed protein product, partial [Bubo scandiacus]